MRRGIVSRIVSGQDVCVFCAFRPGREATARLSRARYGIRDFTPTVVSSSPAGTAVASKDDEGDEETPMLRQNADLSKSFPSRKPVSPSVASQTAQASQSKPSDQKSTWSQRSKLDSQRNRPSHRADKHQIPPSSRENKVNFQGQFNRSRDSRNGNRTEGEPRQNFKIRRTQVQFDRSNDPPIRPDNSVSTPGIRRFVPYSDSSNDVDETVSGSRRLSNGRGQGSGQDEVRNSRQRQNSWNDFREQDQRPDSRPARRYADGYTRPSSESAARGYSEGSRNPQQQDVQDSQSGADAESGIGDLENVEAPAGLSFDNQQEPLDFHRRRGQPEGKRKARGARFEEEETTETESQPKSSRRYQSNSRGFDFEMAEAEEALYGDSAGRRKKKTNNRKQQQQPVQPTKPAVRIAEYMSVAQLAKALDVQLDPFIHKLEEEGFEGARYDHVLDAQTSAMLADIYGFDPVIAEDDISADLVARPQPDDVSNLPSRPPIVTIMGHVDHGKTTILDYLRKSSVVATEHGGITQHIGAFSVTMPGSHRQITFLDTPGHAAFLEMRRRGANVTDIVVLVVAADDSVKPQTVEAIKHAMDAKVQLVVAINKVDKEDADIERVKQDLTRHEIVVEDYGGDFQAIPVSGKTGQGMAELEEAIITLADVNDYRAEQDGPAEGTVIESKVTIAGRVATVLIRRGTLRTGDCIVAGPTWARVRTLRNDMGVLVDEAPPGTPVQVDGWRGEDPTAGLEVLQAEDEKQAKEVVRYRAEQRQGVQTSKDMAAINEARSEEASARAKVLAWEAQQEWAKKTYGLRPKDNAGWVEPEAAGGPKRVHFVVKADVAGSVEAVVAAVTAVGNNEIVANVIHSGTGQVTESDIHMLATTGETGYAISFNQPVEGTIARLAETAGLQILDYNIIYKVTDVVKEKLAAQLPPLVTQKVLGEADVGQIFEITTKKNKTKIAGCRVTNGTISRTNKIRVLRDGQEVYTGTLHSLKNVKKDVAEMRKGTECGMGFEDWEDFREGDQVQCFQEFQEKRTLY